SVVLLLFFFSSRRRHTRFSRDWSSDVCSSDLHRLGQLCGGQPGCLDDRCHSPPRGNMERGGGDEWRQLALPLHGGAPVFRGGGRSEERRVGKECRTRWWRYS